MGNGHCAYIRDERAVVRGLWVLRINGHDNNTQTDLHGRSRGCATGRLYVLIVVGTLEIPPLTHVLVFLVQVDNPCAVLDQENSKKFLQGSEADKYNFFMKATDLDRILAVSIYICFFC